MTERAGRDTETLKMWHPPRHVAVARNGEHRLTQPRLRQQRHDALRARTIQFRERVVEQHHWWPAPSLLQMRCLQQREGDGRGALLARRAEDAELARCSIGSAHGDEQIVTMRPAPR